MSIVRNILTSIDKLFYSGQVPQGTPSGAPQTDDVTPGYCEIIDITMVTEDGQRLTPIKDYCKQIDIYESITSPVIFCDLSIADSVGLLQNFVVLGEEYISISFRTSKNTETAVYLFRLNSVNNIQDTESNKMKTYTLQLCSPELLTNSEKLINKNYENNISEIVREIMQEEIETEKNVSIDPTTGIEKGNITIMQPFKAIDYLRRRAVSKQYISSSFVFFENRNGFHFTTIEKMMDVGGKTVNNGLTDREFFFDTARRENIKDVGIRNIIAFNRITFNDTVSKVQSGGLTSQVNSFDLITGAVRTTTYTSNIGEDEFKGVDGEYSASASSTSFMKKHGKSPAVRQYVPVSSDRPNTQLPDKLATTRAYAQRISQNIVNIHVYGDTELTVGDVIKCTFPSSTSFDRDRPTSKFDSGNYLVSKLRHIIINSDRPQHTMALELIKGNLVEI